MQKNYGNISKQRFTVVVFLKTILFLYFKYIFTGLLINSIIFTTFILHRIIRIFGREVFKLDEQ